MVMTKRVSNWGFLINFFSKMAFSTIKFRPKYNVPALTEAYDRENKRIIVYDYFRPNPKQDRSSEKFYSSHEVVDISNVDPELVILVKMHRDWKPQERYPVPVLESHCYGRFSKPLVPLRKSDPLYYHPLNSSFSSKTILLNKILK